LDSLKASIDADFPAITTMGDILLTSVPESLKDNYSPAAYFTSHVDSLTADHLIVINTFNTSGYSVYETLAHEGFPGHLYQDAYFKNIGINKLIMIMGESSYKEGWATYIESYIAKYYAEEGTAEYYLYKANLESTKASQLLRCVVDIWVNYYGYTRAQVFDALNTNNYSVGSAEYESLQYYTDRVFEISVEVPTNVLKYFYTALLFEELKTAYAQKLGADYSDMAFHTAVMQYGALPINMYYDILL
jgi:uncharacterized protein (DUF885 family)